MEGVRSLAHGLADVAHCAYGASERRLHMYTEVNACILHRLLRSQLVGPRSFPGKPLAGNEFERTQDSSECPEIEVRGLRLQSEACTAANKIRSVLLAAVFVCRGEKAVHC